MSCACSSLAEPTTWFFARTVSLLNPEGVYFLYMLRLYDFLLLGYDGFEVCPSLPQRLEQLLNLRLLVIHFTKYLELTQAATVYHSLRTFGKQIKIFTGRGQRPYHCHFSRVTRSCVYRFSRNVLEAFTLYVIYLMRFGAGKYHFSL